MLTAKETGERIKARRQELRMTQDQLAEKIGYHGKSSISHIEKGDFDMSQSKIVAIAEALQTTPDYILGLKDGAEILIETGTKEQEMRERILRYLEALSENNRETLLKYAEFLAKTEEEE